MCYWLNARVLYAGCQEFGHRVVRAMNSVPVLRNGLRSVLSGGQMTTGGARGGSTNYERSLVEAILASRLTEPGHRDLFVSELTLRLRVDISSHSEARAQAIAVVRACQREPGGLRALADSVAFIQPEAASTTEIAHLVDEAFVAELFRDKDVRAVHALLAAASTEGVAEVWYAAAGDAAPLPDRPIATMLEAFEHLATINARADGIPPALAFVEYLAARSAGDPLRPDLPDRLRAWSERQATEFGMISALARLRAAIATEPMLPPAPACLVIQIQPKPIEPDAYLLSHWLQHRRGHWQPERGPDTEVGAADLERAVDGLVGEAEEVWSSACGEPSIEVVLPVDMMDRAVEWWSAEADAVPLGVEYPLVLRSLERMQEKRWHRPWRNKWESLRKGTFQTHWAPDGSDADTLQRWNIALRSRPELASVALPAPPGQAQVGGLPATIWALRMALRAGAPVVMWTRRHRPVAEFRHAVETLLDGALAELPQRLRALRRTAAESVAVLETTVRHLAVIYDDPNRPIEYGVAGPARPRPARGGPSSGAPQGEDR